MHITSTVNRTARHVLEPLCDSTAELISPIQFQENDRLDIGMGSSENEFIIQAHATAMGKRVAASRAASQDWFDRLAESKSLGYGRWAVGATDFNVMIINALWSSDRIAFTDKNAQSTYYYLLTRFMQQTITAVQTARFKSAGEVPEPPDGWVEHADANLRLAPYQRVAAYNALDSEGYALFMEQGTGKTPTTIAALCHLAKKKYESTKRAFYGIIVCPKNVKANWAREISRFCTVPGRVVVLRGGKIHRIKQLIEIAEEPEGCYFNVVIVSYETLQRSWEAIKMFNWDLGIGDESHMYKSPWAKRSSAMMKLREQCERRLALTGTPVLNSLLDLYYQLEWLGEGMSGFIGWKAFRAFYNKYSQDVDDNYQGAKVLIGFQNLPFLHERLARVAFPITKEEAMPSLPGKIYDLVECGMSKQQADVYSKLARELAAEIDSMLDDSPSGAITVNNVLVKLLRLAQITAGYVVVDEQFNDDGEPLITGEKRIRWFDEVPKMDALIELIKSKSPDEKTIVWSCFRPPMHKISERLTAEGIKHVMYHGGTSEEDREANMRTFNLDPECKVFIGQTKAGGIGVNLPGYDPDRADEYTTNADNAVYYCSNWSYGDRSQSMDRNHGFRRNRKQVKYTDIVVPGTIDMEILTKLETKKAVALEARDVREILSRLMTFDIEDTED